MADSSLFDSLPRSVGTPAQLDEWVGLFANRNEMADQYLYMLEDLGTAWDGWAAVNEAILRRWSPAGLRYIKQRAWSL